MAEAVFDPFSVLDGISPWWWVAIGLALGAVEVLTFSFFLIWPALAALCVAICLWIAPDLSGILQIGIFGVLAAILTVAGRWRVMSRPEKDGAAAQLNNRATLMIGRQLTLSESLQPGTPGHQQIDGTRWRLRLDDGQPLVETGAEVRVVNVDGMILLVARACDA